MKLASDKCGKEEGKFFQVKGAELDILHLTLQKPLMLMLGFEGDEAFHSKKTKHVIRTDTREATRQWLSSASVGFRRLTRWFPVKLATSDTMTRVAVSPQV